MTGQVVIEEQFDEEEDSDQIEEVDCRYQPKWRPDVAPAPLEEPEEEDDLSDEKAFMGQFKSHSGMSSQRNGRGGSQRHRSPNHLGGTNDDSSSFNYQASSNSPAD